MEGYAKWIVARRKRGFRIDGFVLTEHRAYDPDSDYSALSEQYGVAILRGAEVETDIGHVLVYGVTPEFTSTFDLRSVSLPHKEVFLVAKAIGGFAVAAHAGRPRIGLAHYIDDEGMSIDCIEAIEQLNGGSSTAENERATKLAARFGLRGVGGSDAHFVSAIGRCLTAFQRPIATVADLVQELTHGEYHPVTVEQTLEAGAASGGARP